MDNADGRLAALAALNEPVRRRIYRYVAAQGAAVSRDAVADALGVPRSVAAFHLEKLAERGLLEFEYRRPLGRGGPGRAGQPSSTVAPGAKSRSACPNVTTTWQLSSWLKQ